MGEAYLSQKHFLCFFRSKTGSTEKGEQVISASVIFPVEHIQFSSGKIKSPIKANEEHSPPRSDFLTSRSIGRRPGTGRPGSFGMGDGKPIRQDV